MKERPAPKPALVGLPCGCVAEVPRTGKPRVLELCEAHRPEKARYLPDDADPRCC